MRLSTLAIGLSAIALATSASASTNIVQNGGFEQFTNAHQAGAAGQIDSNVVTLANWTTSGYNFLFTPGSADTTGAYTDEFNNQLSLWGPNNGADNGLPATSPLGGNFVGNDGAFQQGPLSQTLNTIAGHSYAITFAWAGAQQFTFSGPTTEAFQVCLGGQCQETPVLSNASHGFTGWHTQSFTFTAQTANDVLSFLAIGTPQGVPPFSLLDGVTGVDTTAVPEAATVGLLGMGLGLAAVARRRK